MHIGFQEFKPKQGGLEVLDSIVLALAGEFPVRHSRRVKMTSVGSFSKVAGSLGAIRDAPLLDAARIGRRAPHFFERRHPGLQ
jgi:hypothetical protein